MSSEPSRTTCSGSGTCPTCARDRASSDDQLVAGPVDAHGVARLGGVFLDLLAQLDDEVVDAARAGVPGDAPDLLQDLLARDRLAGPLPKQAQKLDLVERQRVRLPLARQLVLVRLDDRAADL